KLLPNDSNDTSILGIRSKTLNVIGELLDATSDDDDAWQKFHDEVARKGVSFNVDEGIAKGDFISLVFDNVVTGNQLILQDYTLWVPNAGGLRGNWIVSNVSMSLPQDGLAGFTATINSDGELTRVPAES